MPVDARCAANGLDCRKEEPMKQTKQTILYERLSRDDAGEDSVSNSIVNQQKLLVDNAERNNLKPYRHIQDDGWSGVRWDRPGWQELMAEVEAGRVQNIVVKNLDRMGRDYLRVGLLLEQFRDSNIRLIAVSDGIDTACGEDDFTPFRAILAEWYARDTSKKIRAVFQSRMEAGHHCSGSIPYGYIRDSSDKQVWHIDGPAAEVVRRIFKLVIEGNGVYQIADILAADKVLIPTAYYVASGNAGSVRHKFTDLYGWRGGVVSSILERREYMGILILKKTYSESFKKKKRIETPEEEQLVFEGAIPQIVDEETWNNAQRLRRTVRRPAKDGRPPSPLTGLLVCADCGKKLTHARNYDYQKDRERDEYVCGNYRQGTKNCTMHYVRTSVVEAAILGAIRRVAEYAVSNEAGFIERVRAAFNTRQETEVKDSKKRITKASRRCDELDIIVKKLYETYALGKLPENHFERMLAEYDAEQAALRQEIADLEALVSGYAADSVRADKFIEVVRRYTEFDELTVTMLNEFVEKVVIHEGDRSSGKRVQGIEVHMNFIGGFDIPLPEKSAEEIEAGRRLDEKRRKQSERQRVYRERKKEEAAANLKPTATVAQEPKPAAEPEVAATPKPAA